MSEADPPSLADLQRQLTDLQTALQTAIEATRAIAHLVRQNPRAGALLAHQNSRMGTFGDYMAGQLFTLTGMDNDVRRWMERLGENRPPR
ncbi:MAG TPA: hypothetical protein PK893_14355 [Candidatus Competibacteraceae bacterium]|nr:MAG: hypothetical protein EKK71_11395 [Candidatus Competibacteraceae bacterium]HQA27318.1 hypothetical protein [Candidatus Competibacteraceae bacterium]HQD54978.1 hypothetical protein [Candidatus Competibacteraceae bacterium]